MLSRKSEAPTLQAGYQIRRSFLPGLGKWPLVQEKRPFPVRLPTDGLPPHPAFAEYATPAYICVRAIMTGMVRMEAKLMNATVLDATPVSLPYLAENITVLLALGALA